MKKEFYPSEQEWKGKWRCTFTPNLKPNGTSGGSSWRVKVGEQNSVRKIQGDPGVPQRI